MNKEIKHYAGMPGPWINNGENILAVDHGKYYQVATIEPKGFTREAAQAHAKLIAAAPELLAALQSLVKEYGDNHPLKCWVDARAVLAKATI